MTFENLQLAIDDGVATLTIQRPKALNALNTATLRELLAAVARLAADESVHAVLVTGAGEKAFVAGADVAEMASFGPKEALALSELGHAAMDAVENLSVPVIAAVNGYALGGGLELALACDLIYASDRAKFGLPEVTLGVIPGFGGTARLVARVGEARAREMTFTGEVVDAARAKADGLVLAVHPADALIGASAAVARAIAQRGPMAVRQAKRVMNARRRLQAAVVESERQAFATLFGGQDQKEGMRAFLEKRPAKFTGR